MLPRALTIAGSDSGGGAGVQADLKTFTVFGVYGMSAITALTAQNTRGVTGIHPVPAEFVRRQLDAVLSDIGTNATKTGMLPNAEIVRTVAAAVRDYRLAPLVVDPVMRSGQGAALCDDDTGRALWDSLIPLATLITPNLHEAVALTGMPIVSLADMHAAARACIRRGAQAVLLKGGHLGDDDAVDVFDDGHTVRELRAPRIPTPHTHGTGCQLSAAIAAGLAGGLSLSAAIERAKQFITAAIQAGLPIGSGSGPANPLVWLDRHT